MLIVQLLLIIKIKIKKMISREIIKNKNSLEQDYILLFSPETDLLRE